MFKRITQYFGIGGYNAAILIRRYSHVAPLTIKNKKTFRVEKAAAFNGYSENSLNFLQDSWNNVIVFQRAEFKQSDMLRIISVDHHRYWPASHTVDILIKAAQIEGIIKFSHLKQKWTMQNAV